MAWSQIGVYKRSSKGICDTAKSPSISGLAICPPLADLRAELSCLIRIGSKGSRGGSVRELEPRQQRIAHRDHPFVVQGLGAHRFDGGNQRFAMSAVCGNSLTIEEVRANGEQRSANVRESPD